MWVLGATASNTVSYMRLTQYGMQYGLVFKAHRLWYHAILGVRVMKKKRKKTDLIQFFATECRNWVDAGNKASE